MKSLEKKSKIIKYQELEIEHGEEVQSIENSIIGHIGSVDETFNFFSNNHCHTLMSLKGILDCK